MVFTGIDRIGDTHDGAWDLLVIDRDAQLFEGHVGDDEGECRDLPLDSRQFFARRSFGGDEGSGRIRRQLFAQHLDVRLACLDVLAELRLRSRQK